VTVRAISTLSIVGLLAAPVGRPVNAQTGPQAHWEQYKNQPATPQPDQHLTDPAIVGAIDLHAHHDPDSYPRELDGFDVAKLARDRGLRGVVLKNHWTETAGLAYLARKYATPGFEVFGAVTLDTAVGGVNPQAVRYMVDVVGHLGRIVWMPTHDSEHEVRYNKESRPFVSVSRGGKLLPEVNEVIALVAEHDLALATGHVEPEEALQILRAAKAAGVKRLIVTHPLLDPQFTYMSIEQLRAAADLGAFIEITGGGVIRGGEPSRRALAAIRALGARHFFVGSDAGLVGRENHTDTLVLAARALRAAGVSEADLTLMFKDTPAFLVNLPVRPSQSTAAGGTVWDGVFTEAQASRGEAAYGRSCAACHKEDLLGSATAPALAGEAFFRRWNESTVDDAVQTMKSSMPQDAPNSLEAQAYVDIVTYLLKASGSPTGSVELTADRDRLKLIRVTSAPSR